MNKYKVTRHCERNGYDSTTDSVVFSKSEERAISIVRYSSTRSDKLPNGELTDYINEDGAHVWWTAEQVEIDAPTGIIDESKKTALGSAVEKSPLKPAPELETLETLDEVMKAAEPKTDSVHVIATGESADIFRKIKAELGTTKNTAAFAFILDAFEHRNDDAKTFLLPDDIEARVAKFAEFFGTTREEIIVKAVISYMNKLGNMTINDLLKRKEAQHE